MSLRAAAEAFRRGRFVEAKRFLEIETPRTDEGLILKAETLYYVGHGARAHTDAQKLLETTSSPSIASRCAGLMAAQLWDEGQVRLSLDLSAKAISLAAESSDICLSCRANACLLERSCDSRGYDSSLPLAASVRRQTIRCGDPQLTALVHIVFGRLEARAGRFELARRHFSICRELLREDPNLWLESAAYLDESVVLGTTGDLNGALEVAQKGAQLAAASGWSKGTASAAANLGYLFLSLGRMRDAEAHIDLASNQLFRTATLDAALKETRAYAAFLRSDFSVADELLRAIQRQDTVPTWYHLKAGLTHIRLLLRGAQWEEAENEAARYLNKAIEARVAPMIAEFELARAEALLRSGKSVTGKDLPLNQVTDSAPLSVRAALYTVLANAASLHQQKRSSAWKGRAYRLFLSTGNQAAVTEAGYSGFNSEQFTSISTALPAPDLDSAVALLELAGYPHILGREALAVIRGAACVEAVALIATASAGARVVDLDGWDERQALAAAAKPAEGIEVLPVGRHRDEAWQIVARPRTAVDPYCTFAAIRKLLATAVALDQYRRDEKQRAALWPPEALDGDSEAIWASEQMAETLAIARRIAPTTLSVLVTGETGTGKEMLARAIHRASDRADRAFLPFNCAAVPRDMLESQLFGHRKGAFTGADSAFPGVIRSAAGGTLFLDEIGEIGPDVQPKLLRFLETREIHPLGEPQPLTVDVRVIAATNAGLEELVAGGRFREDLFYRLNVVRLKLPPLRERREEIPPLVHHYLRRFGDEHRKGRLTLSDETLEYLLLYSWPGNVRQLANEVRRMVALAEPDATLTPALLSPEIQASRRTVPAAPGVEPEARLSLDQPLPAAVQTLEQMMVRRALDRTHGRVEEASRLLGISRKGLFLKRRRWGLQQAS